MGSMAAWHDSPVAQVKRLEEESAEALAQAEKAKQAANEAAEHALQDTWHMYRSMIHVEIRKLEECIRIILRKWRSVGSQLSFFWADCREEFRIDALCFRGMKFRGHNEILKWIRSL